MYISNQPDYEDQFQYLTEEIQNTNIEKQVVIDEIIILEVERNDKSVLIKQLYTELENEDDTNENIESQIIQFERQTDQIEEEINDLNIHIIALEDYIDALESQMNKLRTYVYQPKIQVDEQDSISQLQDLNSITQNRKIIDDKEPSLENYEIYWHQQDKFKGLMLKMIEIQHNKINQTTNLDIQENQGINNLVNKSLNINDFIKLLSE